MMVLTRWGQFCSRGFWLEGVVIATCVREAERSGLDDCQHPARRNALSMGGQPTYLAVEHNCCGLQGVVLP